MHLVLINPSTTGRRMWPLSWYPSTTGRRIQRLTLVVPAERMLRKRKFGQRVIVALKTYRSGVAYLADDLDAWSGLANTEAFTSKDLLVTQGMELCETLTEFELAAINIQSAISALLALYCVRRQTVSIDAKEITHSRFLQSKVSRYAIETHHVDDILLDRAKDPLEHIVEVYTDIGSNTAALVDITLPRSVIPLAAGSNVCQINIIYLVGRAFVNLLLQRSDAVVKAELQDIVGLMASLLLHLLERINIIRIEHYRLLANYVAAKA